MGLLPASVAMAEKLKNEHVTSGSPCKVVVKAMLFLPKTCAMIAAAAALNVLCPEVNAGNGGVPIEGDQVWSSTVSEFPSVEAAGMAVIERQWL
jgi:hypothetical protein